MSGVQAVADQLRAAMYECELKMQAAIQERQEAMKELRDAVALARTCEVRSSAHWQVMQLTCKSAVGVICTAACGAAAVAYGRAGDRGARCF